MEVIRAEVYIFLLLKRIERIDKTLDTQFQNKKPQHNRHSAVVVILHTAVFSLVAQIIISM